MRNGYVVVPNILKWLTLGTDEHIKRQELESVPTGISEAFIIVVNTS